MPSGKQLAARVLAVAADDSNTAEGRRPVSGYNAISERSRVNPSRYASRAVDSSAAPFTRSMNSVTSWSSPREGLIAMRQLLSAACQRHSERGHLLAVPNKQDVVHEHGMVPRLAFDGFETRDLGELIGNRLD